MSVVALAEGAVLERILSTTPARCPGGLRGAPLSRCDAALRKLPWAIRHQRRWALMDGRELLASAQQYNLTGSLDRRPVRICAIGDVLTDPSHGHHDYGAVLVERLLHDATRDGVEMAVLLATAAPGSPAARGFTVLPLLDLRLAVAESPRHGAPMILVRGGEDRDLPAIVAMGNARANSYRFHVDRDAELVKYAIAQKRLRAGLGPAGVRQMQFVIAEEGITAAAYVVISVADGAWTIEECGDRDPSGARVGAILQALIAREPAERRPAIHGWLPPGFLPPQVTILSARPSQEIVMTRFLGSPPGRRPFIGTDVLYWRSDVFA